MDLFLTIMKFAGLALSGALGILGTVTDTHEEVLVPAQDGRPERRVKKLTVWGKRLLALTVLGLAVALAAQMAELAKSQSEAQQASLRAMRQTRATQATLDALQRIQFQQSPGRINVELAVPYTNQPLAMEVGWIAKLPKRTDVSFGELPQYPGVFVTGFAELLNEGEKRRGTPFQIRVFPDSPYHPVQLPHSSLAEFFERAVLSFEVWRPTNSSSDAALQLVKRVAKTNDITDEMEFMYDASTLPGAVGLEFDLREHQARLRLEQPLVLSASIRGLTLRDLGGKVICVKVEEEKRPGRRKVTPAFESLINDLQFRVLGINLPDQKFEPLGSDETFEVSSTVSGALFFTIKDLRSSTLRLNPLPN
jgi:hypothetical protein